MTKFQNIIQYLQMDEISELFFNYCEVNIYKYMGMLNQASKMFCDIIKYADDFDIGLLIDKIKPAIIPDPRKIPEKKPFNLILSNKEKLLLFSYTNLGLQKNFIYAMYTLYNCFNSYNLKSNSDIKRKKENLEKKALPAYNKKTSKIGLIQKTDTGMYKLFNTEHLQHLYYLSPGELQEIYHYLIDMMVSHNITYQFWESTLLIKPAFINSYYKSSDNNKKKHYNIIKDSSGNRLVDCKTGINYIIKTKIKPNTEFQGKKYFKSLHDDICNTYLYKLEDCNWCNPNKTCSSRKKCLSCRSLLLKLKTIDKNIKLNGEIRNINYNNVKNLAELRHKRKMFLIKYVNTLAISHIKKENLINEIDTIFSNDIKIS